MSQCLLQELITSCDSTDQSTDYIAPELLEILKPILILCVAVFQKIRIFSS